MVDPEVGRDELKLRRSLLKSGTRRAKCLSCNFTVCNLSDYSTEQWIAGLLFREAFASHDRFFSYIPSSRNALRISAELQDSLGQHLIIIKNLALFLPRAVVARLPEFPSRSLLTLCGS